MAGSGAGDERVSRNGAAQTGAAGITSTDVKRTKPRSAGNLKAQISRMAIYKVRHPIRVSASLRALSWW